MILEIKNGCFGYPKQDIILPDINLSLEEGHILAILGPNGIGKTTLLKCMIGLLPWREGATFLYGQDIKTLKPKELWSNVSYIPQSHGFAFSYTGLEMVMLGRCSHLGVFEQPGRREIEMAEAMMEKTGITHLAKKDCNRMSGGELQMVLIARALINEPKILLADGKVLHEKIRVAAVREYAYKDVVEHIDLLAELSLHVHILPMVREMKSFVPEFKSQNSQFTRLDGVN